MPIESQDSAIYTLIKIKRRGILYSAYPSLQALALPPPQDKQRISPRRAVYKRPLFMMYSRFFTPFRMTEDNLTTIEWGYKRPKWTFRCRIYRGGSQICEI